jgi:hypothetical protein
MRVASGAMRSCSSCFRWSNSVICEVVATKGLCSHMCNGQVHHRVRQPTGLSVVIFGGRYPCRWLLLCLATFGASISGRSSCSNGD